jgi:hypothetical protein
MGKTGYLEQSDELPVSLLAQISRSKKFGY